MSHFDIKLISKISHEVMSPIISSKWALEILLNDKNLNIEEDKRIFLKNIYINLNRISTISNKLINYSRYSVNELLPIFLDADISNLLKKIVKGLSNDFADANIKVLIEGTGFIKPVDQSMVEFIFSSLIHNSIVYSKPSSEVLVSLVKSDKGEIMFEVSDKGIGILAEDQSKIFTEFFRSKNSDDLYAKGIGLSLFLCKKICDVCGYKISFESEEAVGSKFKVLFPSKK
ncbi:hypothetical protein COV25_03285 [candidate division WWE3 bacterium CG10_big_fil_rev_8_21_14_0_10_35_32]|nr:MAG: hypothetical protein COV25_03285 [candidate division WWE3 bacterium CG10_big_fil_rev_8_21_14_0_10_35_32]